MIRLVVLIAVGLLVWLLWRQLTRPATSRRARPRAGRSSPERMVPCAHCGLHVPETEAVRDGDRRYCSRGHLEQSRAR